LRYGVLSLPLMLLLLLLLHYCMDLFRICYVNSRTRLDSDDYWFGMYKETATPRGTTRWYDGNPSTYRRWKTGEPNDNTICIRYTKDGFSDRPCYKQYYYTCKKRAGFVHTSFSRVAYRHVH